MQAAFRCWFSLCLVVLAFSTAGFAQPNATPDGAEAAPVNQTDARGLRQGLWWMNIPAAMGEPASTQLGPYLDGKKHGMWYTMDNDGDLVSIERFSHDLLDGESKYFEKQGMVLTATYLALNPMFDYDTVIIVNPQTGAQFERIIPTDRGSLRHGPWRHYNPANGRLIAEEYYQADELIDRQVVISKTDSAAIERRNAALPHNRKNYPKKPGKAGRAFDPYKE